MAVKPARQHLCIASVIARLEVEFAIWALPSKSAWLCRGSDDLLSAVCTCEPTVRTSGSVLELAVLTVQAQS